MTFQAGVSGNIKGRPKDTGKAKYRFDVGKILSELKYVDRNGETKVGFNPFTELVELAVTTRSDHVRCTALAELSSYVAAKLKSVELTGEEGNPFSITLNLGGSK